MHRERAALFLVAEAAGIELAARRKRNPKQVTLLPANALIALLSAPHSVPSHPI